LLFLSSFSSAGEGSTPRPFKDIASGIIVIRSTFAGLFLALMSNCPNCSRPWLADKVGLIQRSASDGVDIFLVLGDAYDGVDGWRLEVVDENNGAA